MQLYQIGQRIGDFTIEALQEDKHTYTLRCKCGNTTSGTSPHVTRKISNLMAEGFSACERCAFKYRTELDLLKAKNAKLFVFKDVYREYIQKSKEREIVFALSLEEAAKLFVGNCHYCGREPKNKRTRVSGHTVVYQGIDRLDNNVGYELHNVVSCCKYCNSFKNDRSEEEFLDHLKDVFLITAQRPERKLVEPSGSKQETPHAGDDMV